MKHLLSFFLIAAGAVSQVGAATPFGTAGMVRACAPPVNCAESNTTADNQSSLSDALTEGDVFASNKADARYFANLATGAVGALSSARNGTDLGGNLQGAAAYSSVRMFDTLLFSLDPGGISMTLDQDLVLTLTGAVSGVLSVTGQGQAGASYYASIGPETTAFVSYDTGPPRLFAGESIGEAFVLTTTLFRAGTYGALAQKDVFVELALGKQSVLTAGAFNLSGSGSSTADVDFFNTLRITSMTVPQGVTWSSASGVFISAVPEASTWMMLISGLLMLGMVMLRRAARPLANLSRLGVFLSTRGAA